MHLVMLCLALSLTTPVLSWSVHSHASESVDAKRTVKIRVPTSEKPSTCSGILLAENIVATAAHCFETDIKEASQFTVKLGDQTSRASKYYIHNGYEKSPSCHDTAIMVLERNLTMLSTPLYLGCGEQPARSNCTSYGYGYTEHRRDSEVVREASFKLEEEKGACQVGKFETKAKMCTGDSGGPNICVVDGKSVLIGVTTAGDTGIYHNFDYKDQLVLCEHFETFTISNTNTILDVIRQIPDRGILEKLKTINC